MAKNIWAQSREIERHSFVRDTLYKATPLYVEGELRVDSFVISRSIDTLYCVVWYCENIQTIETCYYRSGKVMLERFYNNGSEIVQGWYESGKKSFYSEYPKNDPYTSVAWYENGQKEYEILPTENGYLERSWYESGKIKTESEDNKKGFVNGFYKEWCENGRLIRDELIERGKFTRTDYWCNGKKRAKFTYINNGLYPVGKLTSWHENGVKAVEWYYEDSDTMEGSGIRTGVWKSYNEKGQLMKEEFYENNELIKKKNYIPLNQKAK